jgi:hypothetical protein
MASTLAAAAGVEAKTTNAKDPANNESDHIFNTVRKSACLFHRSEGPM